MSNKIKKSLKYIFLILIFGMVLMYFINPFGVPSWDPRGRLLGFITYRIPGNSMEPSIPKDSMIMVCTASYLFEKPLPGDIVAFIAPVKKPVAYIKRVIAVGGQSISIDNGITYVDGNAVKEPYLLSPPKMTYSREFSETAVPKGYLFVMGDNRDNSNDSRFFDFVPLSSVIGKLCYEF